ncbi:MAG TPA: ABC transporter permease, partial [Chthoniobacterales bacterium]
DNHPGLFGWGRLKDGVTAEQALAQMKEIAARLAVQYPQTNTGISVTMTPLLENQIGDYRGSLNLLLGAVALVLLIACANLANLLAARGAARAREFAVRAAVGASRWQIIRQLLIESFILALAGGLLGLCLAAWGRDLLVALAPPGVPRFQNISLNNWVLLFSLGLSFGTSILFGLWPAWHTSRADIQLALKSGGGHGSSEAPGARRSRDLLVIAEVALTLVLLSTAGLVLKSFANARNLGLGFDPQLLLSARIDLPSPTYSDEKKLINFTEALLQKLSVLPGVQNAAVASNPPLMTGWQTSFVPEGMAEPEPGKAPAVEMAIATEGYFQTIKTPLLRGRVFEATDTKEAPPVIIVDQLLAERYFPGQDAVGKHIAMHTGEKGAVEHRTIVGVVPHLKVYGFEETVVLPQAYLPMKQQPSTALVVLLRTTLSPKSLEKPVREIVASLDPAQPAFDFKTMRERVEETWATPRLMSFLLVCFAVLALTLAVVGLYGVMAFNGLRRMREIGVRLALGAMPSQIRMMMLGQGLRLLGAGLVLGFGGAMALSRLIRSLLYGVDANDPLIYATVTLVLIAASIVACWLPARRASRVNPMITLRAE